ncbi:hypothetical protein T10_2519 [Trichinella papuae]|uniref:Uncharacterized protein n=1 Tax=Trichinella papuae TaxID=268474 RepID=A0A0V1N7R6_9BILA|nr:hypothetical protein T10_2519 [Trichinella papuae]
MRRSVRYLGQIVTLQDIGTDSEKTEAVDGDRTRQKDFFTGSSNMVKLLTIKERNARACSGTSSFMFKELEKAVKICPRVDQTDKVTYHQRAKC